MNKGITNWFEIAHFRYKIIKLTKLSLKQVCALKECNSQQCRSVKKKQNKNRIFYMCIQIICILETEESVQMSQLRIKE